MNDNKTQEQPVEQATIEDAKVEEAEDIKAEQEIEKEEAQETVKPKKDFSVDVRSIRTQFFDPVIWQQMKGMAEVFKNSGALGGEENASTLVMKIQAGYEMGMKPIEAIKSFYFVGGKINVFGAAVVRRLREHGWKIEYADKPNKCTATISKGDEKYTDTLTFEEAEKSGWTSSYGKLKPGWLEGANRKLKLRYGVTSMLIKTYVPEVLGSAVDIAEVAIDTVPLFEESTTAQTPELPAAPDDDKPITDAQKATILGIAAKNSVQVDVEGMTQKTAKAWIRGMAGEAKKKK